MESFPDSETIQMNDVSLDDLVKLNKMDRDLYEKSIKAFVSWVRSYNEHQANFIFNIKNIDLGRVAKAFGLFRVRFIFFPYIINRF